MAGWPRRHAPLTIVPEPLGLYVHVPFCSAICHYCNFNRGLMDPALKVAYVDALVTHISRAAEDVPIDTIYFGGGTPSLLEPDEIARVLAACAASFSIGPGTEVTMEANPETVDEVRLAGFRAAGVNRLSFGVQSFLDDELRRLGRLHDAARAREALAEARRSGFDNVSLDLMMWLPGQSVAQWLQSVDALIEVAPDHASLYLLELYPNAPLQELMARQQWSQTPEDDAADMYEAAMERLEAVGLCQYEISNVARPGRESRHNLKYWRDSGWLAFGCGAHGSRDGRRWKHVADTRMYIERVAAGAEPTGEARMLDPEAQLGEALFMGLRLTEGIATDLYRVRFGQDVWTRYGEALAPAVEAGLLVREMGRIRLTRRGMLLANEVMQVFV
ncbi:Oxygen-independent coproporphyrinogen-III oxidase 1 [Luteitalea pratensis]|uniref:Heme chaperone HemW n=1 Tax=Luteitalea pratensis TaxID=1855912 RepID=A0A143PTU9_LUTPR|nr:radical SAM family heme chaperone HemW [Luteitalea pratensis]AMY11224.1 Oxygen-independent coproporphyrinogen-III oxidase 1 [Luteitalea pratensis]